ncbi:hypothetical protein AB835_09795 [Candidatus Endobugula sertula]|uniref:Uncharacterized protein n=1 Tax=Candidatus Endobugula sertula TaxID=62101 RepID=A0A1D2QNV5_9GAMM|nr:hypothetical protein AB835_09795 [Candidatus Endobugula sertula]
MPLASVLFLPVYAEDRQPLGAILGAQLIKASKGEINDGNYSDLHFNRCAAIEKYLGFTDDPLGRAIEYSCKGLVIGITLYAGKDLGKHPPEKIAQHFKNELEKHFMTSEVFIKHNHEYGSAMAFFINGETYEYN